MSNQLKMGNISRAATDIKKKLELSFMNNHEETEIDNSINTKKSMYGKNELKSKEPIKESTKGRIPGTVTKKLPLVHWVLSKQKQLFVLIP